MFNWWSKKEDREIAPYNRADYRNRLRALELWVEEYMDAHGVVKEPTETFRDWGNLEVPKNGS